MGSPPMASVFLHAPFVRHLALCVATLVAYLARHQLGAGNSVLWILGFSALLNLVTAFLGRSPRVGRVALLVSTPLVVAGWIALMLLTGGGTSPFVAGLLLEIVLAGMTGSLGGVVLTTGAGIAGLWSIHVLAAHVEPWVTPALRTGFLLATGAVTAYVTWRTEHSAKQIWRQHEDALRRLDRLEKDFDEASRFGKMGENAALLAHGFKNSVHSLRGYTRLIEPRLAASTSNRDLIDGLTCAIDGLEDLARTSLGAGISPRCDGSGSSALKNGCVVRDVVREVGAAFPEVRWSLALADLPPLGQPFRAIVREALAIVVRNAAEAMQGKGLVAVEASRRNGTLEIRVRDNGPGLSSSAREVMFRPGRTTKPDGHGLGLFLARRALEARGGGLSLSAAEGGGTLSRIELPLGSRAIEHDEAISPHH